MRTDLDIRPIEPEDAERIADARRYTSEDTYYRRFHAAKAAFSPRELEYLTEVDGHDHVALIALEHGGGRLAAVARFVRLPGEQRCAEAAITVHDPYQGQGLGREILLQLLAEAIRLEVRTVIFEVQADNVRMVRLLLSLPYPVTCAARHGSTATWTCDLGADGATE
jgi:RimJ/RimL family protein N-acetyltransferase